MLTQIQRFRLFRLEQGEIIPAGAIKTQTYAWKLGLSCTARSLQSFSLGLRAYEGMQGMEAPGDEHAVDRAAEQILAVRANRTRVSSYFVRSEVVCIQVRNL